jgi:hypothetical protein
VLKTVIFHAVKPGFEKLAYHDQWARAWLDHPGVRGELVNLARGLTWAELRKVLSAELIVFLHSTNSNEFVIPNSLRRSLRFARGIKIFFVGNEYKLMPEKLALLDELRIDFACSQLPQASVEWLYSPCLNVRAVSLAHALDSARYQPKIETARRPLDIGVRAFEYPWYLGDRERAELIEYFLKAPRLRNFRTDISMDPSLRFAGEEWAEFLNRCRATISTEAGATFLQRDDRLRNAVNAYQNSYPHARYEEVFERFFKDGVPDSVSGKCLSSRHMEAIGTRTAQIMFPGLFNGILKPDLHYIALKRDYSNLESVLDRLEDISYLEKMTAETLEYCLAEHQLKHRIDALLALIRRT